MIRATNSAGSDDWTVDYSTAAAVASATVTVDLGTGALIGNRLVWPQNVDLGTTFDADGIGQELSQVDLYFSGDNAGQVILSITGPNNRFTSAFEATGRILFESSDGEILEITIDDADMSEPYDWTPANSAEVIAFGSHVATLTDRSVTLSLTGEAPAAGAPSFTDDTGDAQAWTVGTQIAAVTVPEASGTPAPTYAVVGALPGGIQFNATTRVL